MTLHYLCRWQSIIPCSILHQLLKNIPRPKIRKFKAAFIRFGHRSVFIPTLSRCVRPCPILWYMFQYYFPSTSGSPRWFLLPLRPSDWTAVCISLLCHACCRKVKENKLAASARSGLFVSHTEQIVLPLILVTWRKWWAPNNASKWQMGFNSAFKGLRHARLCCFVWVKGESWNCPARVLSA